MAVKARDQLTVVDLTDAQAITLYYLLQASTLSAPSKPTVLSPTNWSTSEPAFTSTTTNILYTCVRTLWGDGSFDWGDVQVSSSYEAAKTAYNKATAVSNYFFHDTDGAHVSTVEEDATTGPNVLMSSSGFQVRNGTTVLSNIDGDSFDIYKANGTKLVTITAGSITPAQSYTVNVSSYKLTGSGSTEGSAVGIDMSADVGAGEDTAWIGSSLVASGGDKVVSFTSRILYTGVPTSPSANFSEAMISADQIMFYDQTHNHAESYTMREFIKMLDSCSTTILYDGGTTGTDGTITLSETAANFTEIRIYYRVTADAYDSENVYSPNGKSVSLTGDALGANGNLYIKASIWAISGTSITPDRGGMWVLLSDGSVVKSSSSIPLYITRVVGWK